MKHEGRKPEMERLNHRELGEKNNNPPLEELSALLGVLQSPSPELINRFSKTSLHGVMIIS